MAKMRVHELAKELNIKSQDIIETLSGTDYAVKSASSGIEDEAQKVVRNKFAKKDDCNAVIFNYYQRSENRSREYTPSAISCLKLSITKSLSSLYVTPNHLSFVGSTFTVISPFSSSPPM